MPVSREEVTVEREPITDAKCCRHSGPAISEEEHEVTLRAERPVVEKEAVPVEQVRLGTETRTEHETIGGEDSQEQIESAPMSAFGLIAATANAAKCRGRRGTCSAAGCGARRRLPALAVRTPFCWCRPATSSGAPGSGHIGLQRTGGAHGSGYPRQTV